MQTVNKHIVDVCFLHMIDMSTNFMYIYPFYTSYDLFPGKGMNFHSYFSFKKNIQEKKNKGNKSFLYSEKFLFNTIQHVLYSIIKSATSGFFADFYLHRQEAVPRKKNKDFDEPLRGQSRI